MSQMSRQIEQTVLAGGSARPSFCLFPILTRCGLADPRRSDLDPPPGPTLAGAAWSRPALDPERFLSGRLSRSGGPTGRLSPVTVPQTLEQRLPPPAVFDLAALHRCRRLFYLPAGDAGVTIRRNSGHGAHLLSWLPGIWASAGYIGRYRAAAPGRPSSGQVCSDFGGGIGCHALAAASLAGWRPGLVR